MPQAAPWPPQPGAQPWPGASPAPASGRVPSLAVLAFVAAAAAVVVPTFSILAWHLFIELPFWQVLNRVSSVIDGLFSLAALVIGILVVRRPARVERLAGGLAIGAGAVGLLESGVGLVLTLLFLLFS